MINYKLVLVIIITVFQLISCRTLKNNNDLKNAVLNKEDISYSVILFFQTNIKGEIGYISAYELRRNLLYDEKYNNYDLDSLLSKALKGNYVLNCSSLSGCFKLSGFIEDWYEKQSFKSFLNNFTEYNDVRNLYIIHTDLTKEEKLTVVYFLYINGYYTVFDDYDNIYFATKGIRKPIIEEVELIEN